MSGEVSVSESLSGRIREIAKDVESQLAYCEFKNKSQEKEIIRVDKALREYIAELGKDIAACESDESAVHLMDVRDRLTAILTAQGSV